MEYQLKTGQTKQLNQFKAQGVTFNNSNYHPRKINGDDRKRGLDKAKIIFLANQAVRQKGSTLPTNKLIASFANCKVRGVQEVINQFLDLRKGLSKITNNVRHLARFQSEDKIMLKETMLKTVFGYYNSKKQLWEHLE